MRSGAYVTLRAIAIVDSDGTLIACHWLPAYDVLPPHGAGVAARTPAVTPAALVITTSAAATVVRSDRTRTDGLSEAGREGQRVALVLRRDRLDPFTPFACTRAFPTGCIMPRRSSRCFWSATPSSVSACASVAANESSTVRWCSSSTRASV